MRIEMIRPDNSATASADAGWSALGRVWRALEAEAECSVFQSWTWLGVAVAQRFNDPWLLRATGADGRVVGLALFNRTGPKLARTLWLHETGRRRHDSVFIEHNAPLLAHGHEHLLRPMLALAARHGRLVLGGVGEAVLLAARSIGGCHIATTRPAAFVALRDCHNEAVWLATLSRSTRYRLRRSRRAYEAGAGEGRLTLRAAGDVAEALAFLDALAVLHQASWTGRGQPGAFVEPAFTAFHRALVARGLPRGEVRLLRISTRGGDGSGDGGVVLGYLYNLCWQGRVYAYQSGFDFASAQSHQLPGLTCHHLAIADAIDRHMQIYDFMGGAARYKTSLGHASIDLHWLQIMRPSGIHDIWRRLRHAARRMMRLWWSGTTESAHHRRQQRPA